MNQNLSARGSVRKLILLALIPLAMQASCKSPAPPVPREARQGLGVLAIVPAQYEPRTNFAAFAKSKPAGTAKGAAVGWVGLALVAGMFATPYTMILIPYVAAVGAVTGTVEGALGTPSAAKVQQVEASLNSAVAKLDTQHALAAHVTTLAQRESWIRLRSANGAGPASAAASPAYADLRTDGIDTVLEIAVSEIGFEPAPCGRIPSPMLHNFCQGKTQSTMFFYMEARARLVRVADGAELFVRQFRYWSPWREAARWEDNNGQLLAQEFDTAYGDISNRIVDEALLVTHIALPSPSIFLTPDKPMSGACWLIPVYPKAERAGTVNLFSDSIFSMGGDLCTASHTQTASPLRFVTVDSLRPTLRWSSFPRELDRAQLDPALLHKISDVSYDMKIWEAENCERGRLVYERTGLSLPEHQLDEALKPAQRYFWSFRARFAIDGQPMATRWSFLDLNGCHPGDITDWMYYRFATPK